MTLEQYRSLRGLSYGQLAAHLKVTAETARRYCKGLRVPRPDVMARISTLTNKAVTSESFYK